MKLLNGQWVGSYSGTNSGTIVVDIDDLGDFYSGVARLADSDSELPPSIAFFRTSDKSLPAKCRADILPLDPLTGRATTLEVLRENFPDVIYPSTAEVELLLVADALNVSWSTEIGTGSAAILPRSNATRISEYTARKMSWGEFRDYASSLDFRRFIFRGQSHPWRLRTNFHRTGRANLNKFLSDDIQSLHRSLSVRTRHVFDLDRPIENGAFMNLVQHHGYPTPLLDWTHSPFVAIYFAYSGITKARAEERGNGDRVRLFVFDQKQWCADFPQLQMLTPVGPHFSIMEFSAIDNERMIPQQAISSVTNVDDIESYIRGLERKNGKSYLTMVDLPISDRRLVMRELSTMGITGGSLFPGLDGACAEIRERLFDL